ncbi:DUF6603 domain-containing protein [Flavisolibacter ginsenosidimutans]|uniref:DUF6603 domain-containing protein n=1 Tax=Flavisolibacter ginsenosidimutans TaxID=661481 RepID=A0A5B8UIN5_9BACT|nr:DUF6603 domain-containing protein [Flavisolibacter ginsenosidimutans]QEC56282.1 hypothetical protein FSB75_10385 [Flavisolibacter ginsenosidimutans]
MPDAAGTLETLALELGKALEPLPEILRPDMFARLGLPLPSAIVGNGGIATKLLEAAAKAGELPPKITALATAVAGGNELSIISDGAQLIAIISQLVVKFEELGSALNSAANSLPPADKAVFQQLAAQLPVRILEYSLVGYLAERLPNLTTTLNLLGIVDKEVKVPATLETGTSLPVVIPRRFYIDRLPQLLSNPVDYFKQVYKLGLPGFTGQELMEKVQGLLAQIGFPAELYIVGGQLTLEAYIFKIQTDTSTNPPGLKFEINVNGAQDFDRDYPFSDLWKGTVHVHAAFAAGISGTLRPPFELALKPPSGNLVLDLLLGIKAAKSSNEPLNILSLTKGAKLQAKSISGSVGVNINLGTAGGSVLPAIQIGIEEGKLIIDFSEGDGFIQKMLSGVHVQADFGLLGAWNPKDGLRLQGSGGVEVFIPIHLDLVIVQINGLYFKIAFSTEAPLKLGLGAQITTNLGPLKAVVDGIGTNIPITFPSNGKGRLGLADIDFKFQPPKGVGLSLDTGVIKGGGFLSIDVDKGEYIGVLELSFQGFIDLKAIGIINTKMPDGSTGFALLILITAEFTPIQLGFGFTLNGVGGLLAVNRSTDLDALRTGVRTGAISSILFPQDIVANVTRIISDLKAIFPIVEGHFIIAPMAKIGWGTPTLISLELGIIIDIPTPQLVILGVLRCVLPTEDAAILKLQVNFAGGINFDKGLLWFDASLFDSRLLVFTLTGDMALRIGWGDEKVFIVSVGGFHPAFHEIPKDLTGMKRLSISLLSGDNPRITVATYFAITSNTVQSGARAELYAEACGFNVFGYIGYDLLVQFNPFYFIADISAGLALRSGDDEIAGIHVHCQLSGPTPWHAVGDGSLEILFFSISVGFDVTWGEDAPSQPDELEDVLADVVNALNDDRNWKATLPPNTNTNVTIKKIELPPDQLIIHPFTLLSVSQKIVPLEMEINKFGNKKPKADTKFTLTNSEGGTPVYVNEEFAVANYVKLSDSEKLSRKSFEQMKSGLQFQTTNDILHGVELHKDVTYELSYVHRKKNLVIRLRIFKLLSAAFNVLVKGSAVHKNAFAVSRKAPTNPPAKVAVTTPAFSVVNVSDLALAGTNTFAASEAEAYAIHDELVRKNPSLKNQIQVVSQFELN